MKKIIDSSLGVVLLIFFFNRCGLPYGLEFSVILAPLFIIYLQQSKLVLKLFLPFYFFIMYSVIHLLQGVIVKDFIVSTFVLFTLLIFTVTFYTYYKKSVAIPDIIKRIAQVNFVLTLLALVSLFSGIQITYFWYLEPFTPGYEVLPRLKIFELEASHYSFAILPIFYYYFWTILKTWEWKNFLYLLSIILSLLLSFSLGVLAVIVISLIVVFVAYFWRFIQFPPTRIKLIGLCLVAVSAVLVLFLFFPENPLSFRLQNLLAGNDTSGRGRTYEAFEIGWQVLSQHNPLFGIGLGQFKIIGRETLIYYYKFANMPEVARLPNAMAETLVVYGIVGFSLKLLLQIGLFVKMKVYQNVFQLSLFLSLFVYQFTGSYVFNEMEYVFWIMAFFPKLQNFQSLNYFKR
jgi:hypothetical protein